MLARKHKIHGRPDIQLVFEKGRKLRVPAVQNFSIRCLQKKTDRGGALFSIVVPTALKLNPVKRNRIRRRVYEAIRKNLSLTKAKNCDIVIVVHRPLDRVDFSKIESDIINLLNHIP